MIQLHSPGCFSFQVCSFSLFHLVHLASSVFHTPLPSPFSSASCNFSIWDSTLGHPSTLPHWATSEKFIRIPKHSPTSNPVTSPSKLAFQPNIIPSGHQTLLGPIFQTLCSSISFSNLVLFCFTHTPRFTLIWFSFCDFSLRDPGLLRVGHPSIFTYFLTNHRSRFHPMDFFAISYQFDFSDITSFFLPF